MDRRRSVDVEQRRANVVAAAREVFLRYGYVRTTMNDLAEAAALSRPGLYLVFPSKDEIFAAVIDLIFGEYFEDMRRTLPACPDLPAKLHHAAEGWAGAGYDLLQQHPDAKDIFNLALPPVRDMYTRLTFFYADLLDAQGSTRTAFASSRDLAELLIFGMRGLKEIAKDAEDMRRLVALNVEMVLAAVGASATRKKRTGRSPD